MKANNGDLKIPPEVGTIYWLDPLTNPPPSGRIFILTKGNVPMVGKWGDDCKAWQYIFKLPAHMKNSQTDFEHTPLSEYPKRDNWSVKNATTTQTPCSQPESEVASS